MLKVRLEADVLGALPQGGNADLAQALEVAGNAGKVVAGERARLGGEVNTAVGDQDFGFTLASRVEQDLSRRGIGGGVLVPNRKIHVAEWNPDALATPAHVHDLAFKWQHAFETRRRSRVTCLFPARHRSAVRRFQFSWP